MENSSFSFAIDEIRNRCNIVDIISPVVPLKRAGSNFKGCCPFHKEKTPSFVVSEKKQIFTCFGCGATGNAISFTQKYYNISFPDAVRRLAQQYGIEIDDAYERQGKKRDVYYEANRKAARFFYDCFTKTANPGYAYMKKRGIQPQIMQKFGIGYCDDEWTSLTDFMKSQGVAPEMLEELGLAARSRKEGKSDRYYDKFRGRVMFPIFNTMGKVIGFGGRTLGNGEPKYLNSPESPVFLKKNNLYGLNLSKGEIQNEGFAIVVEGYMDVIGLYQAGIRNVTASLGTALTENQARLLKKYTTKVVLCYDSDNAGIKAALRGIDVLRDAGLDVRVIQVDDGKDPDEYIKKHGADEFRALIDKKSMTDVDYKIMLLRRRFDLRDISQSVNFLKEAASVIKKLSPVEADLYIKKVARENGLSEGALKREVDGIQVTSTPPPVYEREEKKEEIPAKQVSQGQILLEKTLIRLCIQRADFWPRLKDYAEAFETENAIEVTGAFRNLYTENSEFDMAKLKENLSESGYAYLNDILNNVFTGEDEDAAFADCIHKLESIRKRKRRDEIMDILSLAEGNASEEQIDSLMRELASLGR
ncbi:MAG: DNA primase [Clostridia bacterium]|nr:DNA primase [Clostridia bacterium]